MEKTNRRTGGSGWAGRFWVGGLCSLIGANRSSSGQGDSTEPTCNLCVIDCQAQRKKFNRCFTLLPHLVSVPGGDGGFSSPGSWGAASGRSRSGHPSAGGVPVSRCPGTVTVSWLFRPVVQDPSAEKQKRNVSGGGEAMADLPEKSALGSVGADLF